MLAAYTHLKNAEKVRKFIMQNELMNKNVNIIKELDHIYFPLKKKANIPFAEIVNTKFEFKEKERKSNVEDLLKGRLTPKEIALIPKAQEVVGKILILEIPFELKEKEKIIAEAFLQANKSIETVVRKAKEHSGIFRLRKVKILAGKKNKETIHVENGIKLKLHLEKTYFSARSGNERLRVAKQVKKNEEVLVMFSGAAPYCLVIAKNSLAKSIEGIEINPDAYNYALENVELNNLQKKIKLYLGDVRNILADSTKRYDHIIMPLPKTGEEFLGLALSNSKKGTIINFYAFLEEKYFIEEEKKIIEICKENNRIVKILNIVKCGQFSPKVFRVCFDILVKN